MRAAYERPQEDRDRSHFTGDDYLVAPLGCADELGELLMVPL